MKTRRVLGTAKVTCPCKQLRYDERILNGLACAQEVELAVYEEVPPKERVVLPEGMKWDGNNLWYHGLLVAHIYNTNNCGFYVNPNCVIHQRVTHFNNLEEGQRIVESALAEHGYFGVRKVVDNE